MQAMDYISELGLIAHPEGGFFLETYRSKEVIQASAHTDDFPIGRHIATAIYFLLEAGDFSAFHRIKSDECWHFYAGGPLLIHVIQPDGIYYAVLLGCNVRQMQLLQFVVPANSWFASEPADKTDFSLVGCTVSPGFDFCDFELAASSPLCEAYPAHASLILRLTRQ